MFRAEDSLLPLSQSLSVAGRGTTRPSTPWSDRVSAEARPASMPGAFGPTRQLAPWSSTFFLRPCSKSLLTLSAAECRKALHLFVQYRCLDPFSPSLDDGCAICHQFFTEEFPTEFNASLSVHQLARALSLFAQNQQAFFDSSHGNTLIMCSRPMVPHLRSFVKGIFEPSDRVPLVSQLSHQQTERATSARSRELGLCSRRLLRNVIVSWIACSNSSLSGKGFVLLCSSP